MIPPSKALLRSDIVGRISFARALRSTESRLGFAIWVCRQHNLVNQKLNKVNFLKEQSSSGLGHAVVWIGLLFALGLQPLFDCSIRNLDDRWRDGRPHCFADDKELASDTLGRGDATESPHPGSSSPPDVHIRT